MFERLMFKRLEMWLVAILLMVVVAAGGVFGWAVNYTKSGGKRLGVVGEWAVEIAQLPRTLMKTEVRDRIGVLAVKEVRFEGESGFQYNYAPGSRPALGYLLLNRYDADKRQSVSELVDLNTQAVLHQWRFDVDPLWDAITFESQLRNLQRDEATYRFRNIHALPGPDGSLFTKSHESPIIQVSSCGAASVVLADNLYHHSLEMDDAGVLWASSLLEPPSFKLAESPLFRDDAIVGLQQDGTIVLEKSVAEILDENGLGYMVHGGPQFNTNPDPTHLNDVEPVRQDGSYWKKGDLFLSLRHLSMVLLYRPSENKIIWHRQGDWLRQHDVDIVSDGVIAVFDNNLIGNGPTSKVDGFSRFVVYDFARDMISEPFADALAAVDFRTPSEGRSELLPTGELYVEETDSGRLLLLNPDGSVALQYINRADEGRVFELNWSRWLPREAGDTFAAQVKAAGCS